MVSLFSVFMFFASVAGTEEMGTGLDHVTYCHSIRLLISLALYLSYIFTPCPQVPRQHVPAIQA